MGHVTSPAWAREGSGKFVLPPRAQRFTSRWPWIRPQFLAARWLSRHVPAPWRARIISVFARPRKSRPNPPVLTPYSPVLWRRPPLLVCLDDREACAHFFEHLGSRLSQSFWPSFLLFPHRKPGTWTVASLDTRIQRRVVSLQVLPKSWAAPLGLVMPAEPEATSLAQEAAQQTGYPLGQSLQEFLGGSDTHPEIPHAPVDSRFDGLFPKVSILVVTHNRPELTDLCLRSLKLYTDYPNWELVVVDNGSDRETRTLLQHMQDRIPHLRLSFNSTNRGFPAACNQAAEKATGEIFCFLNNDTVVSPGWLSALVDELLFNPGVGLVGPVSNGVSNEARVKVPWAPLEELPLWAICRSQKYFRCSRSLSTMAFYCVATWRSLWQELGGLDESFGLGLFEDDEYCLRLRHAGYAIRCRLDSYVHHFQSSTFSKLSDTKYLRLYEHNRRLFASKRRALGGGL